MARKNSDQINDNGLPGKYFHIIYNMADDDLGVYEYRLYGHYRRVCGAENGACWESTRTTAKKCQMSVGKVAQTRRELENKGYIKITERGDDTLFITLVDRMAENVARYVECSPDEHDVHTVNSSVHGVNNGVHDMKQRRTSKEEPTRKTNKKKETPNGVAPSEHVAASAILDAWLKHSMVIIEEGKNIYAIKAYTNKAKALHKAGVTPDDVVAFIAHLRTDKYHRDRGITLDHVARDILAWKLQHAPTPEPEPAPVENPARPDYPYSNLSAEQHAELDAAFEEAMKNL